MDQVSLQGIEPSVGTRMFNLFGLLSILFNLNQEKKQICSPLSNKKRIPKECIVVRDLLRSSLESLIDIEGDVGRICPLWLKYHEVTLKCLRLLQ